MPDIVSEAEQRRQFHTLDALRGVAALEIVSRHSYDLFGAGVFPESYLAVDLFFIMSGVVIANAYDNRLRGVMTGAQFARVRAIRLYPLYALGLLIAAAQAIVAERAHHTFSLVETFRDVGLASLMLLGPYNGPRWSLFYEAAINLVYGFAHRFLTRGVLVTLVVLGAVGVVAVEQVYGSLDIGWNWQTSWAGFARVLYSFTLGVLLARAGAGKARINTLAASALLCVAAVALAFAPPLHLRGPYGLGCALILFPSLVWAAMRVDVSEPLRRAFSFLGLTSYAVYVLHQPTALIVTEIIVHVAHRNPSLMHPYSGIGFTVAMLGFAYIADRFYDRPVRKRLAKLSAASRLSPAP